jgi:paraquat-inducible protein A
MEPLPKGHQAVCSRCGATLLRALTFSREFTAALSLAALFLYVPANIYPMISMSYMGRVTENTVWGGVQALWNDGMWGVAIVVFLASILIPLFKLIGLFF